MNTERDYKSEELNESELDNVAGGAADDDMITPEDQEAMDRIADEKERARHEGAVEGEDYKEDGSI